MLLRGITRPRWLNDPQLLGDFDGRFLRAAADLGERAPHEVEEVREHVQQDHCHDRETEVVTRGRVEWGHVQVGQEHAKNYQNGRLIGQLDVVVQHRLVRLVGKYIHEEA